MINLNHLFRSFSTAKYSLEKNIPTTVPKRFMNMMEAINDALDIAMRTDATYTHQYSELRYLERMWSLEVSFGAPKSSIRNMERIEYSTLLCVSKES